MKLFLWGDNFDVVRVGNVEVSSVLCVCYVWSLFFVLFYGGYFVKLLSYILLIFFLIVYFVFKSLFVDFFR